MKILVLGAGGIGGYFGGRLAQSGADVTFLVRPKRADALRANGLVIQSPKSDAKLDVKTVTSETLDGAFELVILSCKAYDLASALDSMREAVGAKTLILPLLNGVRHLDTLDEHFGKDRVLGGYAQIAVMLRPTGEIAHLNPMDTLGFGPRTPAQPEQNEASKAIFDVFKKAGFDARLSTDVLQDMWDKFIFLTTLASMTCLLRGSVGEILATQDGESLLRRALEECQAIAKGSGHPHSAPGRERTLQILSDRSSKLTASMMRDLEAGNRIESDAIVGDMLMRGRDQQLPVVLLQAAYSHLQTYERKRFTPQPH